MRAPRVVSLPLLFFRISALNELQYRVNFFLQLLQSLVALFTALAVLALVFSHTDELAGWSPPELLVVMGVHIAVGGLIRMAIQPNMLRLIEDVRQGTLDYALTKPEDAQLLASIREFRLWQGTDLFVGAAVVAAGVWQHGETVGIAGALAFAVTIVLGVVMIYCFWLALTSGAFWIVRMEFLVELFDGVYQAGRWPVTVYPGALRVAFTILVPLAFAVTVPAQALTGRLTWPVLLAAAAFAAILGVGTRALFRFALRHYSGASA